MSSTSVVPKPNPAHMHFLRQLFSFPMMLAGLLVVLAALTVNSRFDDPDMWWHLKVGEIIYSTHRIPTTDLFSYTTNHHAWVPHEWLSQLLIYSAYKWGGYRGLMLWLSFFTAVLLVAGYALCSMWSGNAKVGFLGTLVIWLFATVGLAIRPQLIGYTLLILELLVLHLGSTRNPRWFFWLPPLFAVWVNCHGSFFLGLVLAGVFIFTSQLNFQAGLLKSANWVSHCSLKLALALGLSAAALFLNPIGVKQILYPVDTILSQPIGLGNVDEWLPLQLSGIRAIGYLVVLGSIFLIVICKRSELFWHELLLLALGAWLAASHQRMLFVFGILAAPTLSRLLSGSWDDYRPEHDHPLPNAAIVAISLLTVLWSFPDHQSLKRQIDENNPVKAVEFIKASHLPEGMLNEYRYGGYLIWAAPEYPVFVDGRADVFEWTGVLSEFGAWATVQSDPNILLDKYKVNFCLLAIQSPIVRVLRLLDGWKVIYSDNKSVVFMRTTAPRPVPAMLAPVFAPSVPDIPMGRSHNQ